MVKRCLHVWMPSYALETTTRLIHRLKLSRFSVKNYKIVRLDLTLDFLHFAITLKYTSSFQMVLHCAHITIKYFNSCIQTICKQKLVAASHLLNTNSYSEKLCMAKSELSRETDYLEVTKLNFFQISKSRYLHLHGREVTFNGAKCTRLQTFFINCNIFAMRVDMSPGIVCWLQNPSLSPDNCPSCHGHYLCRLTPDMQAMLDNVQIEKITQGKYRHAIFKCSFQMSNITYISDTPHFNISTMMDGVRRRRNSIRC